MKHHVVLCIVILILGGMTASAQVVLNPPQVSGTVAFRSGDGPGGPINSYWASSVNLRVGRDFYSFSPSTWNDRMQAVIEFDVDMTGINGSKFTQGPARAWGSLAIIMKPVVSFPLPEPNKSL